MMIADKRQYPRIEIAWPVTLMTPYGPVGGTTRNLSLGGACIRLAEMPELEEVFRLVIRPAEQQMLPATAELVWSDTLMGTLRFFRGWVYILNISLKIISSS